MGVTEISSSRITLKGKYLPFWNVIVAIATRVTRTFFETQTPWTMLYREHTFIVLRYFFVRVMF